MFWQSSNYCQPIIMPNCSWLVGEKLRIELSPLYPQYNVLAVKLQLPFILKWKRQFCKRKKRVAYLFMIGNIPVGSILGSIFSKNFPIFLITFFINCKNLVKHIIYLCSRKRGTRTPNSTVTVWYYANFTTPPLL